MSLSVFMVFAKFLILMIVSHSVIFSGTEAPVEQQTRLPLTISTNVEVFIDIIELDDDWTSVSVYGSSHKSLPKTKSQIFAFLTSEDHEEQETIKDAKEFIDRAYALKKEKEDKIKAKKSTIENTAREALLGSFEWASITPSNLEYPWSSPAKARTLIKDGLVYYNLAWEIKSLMDDGRLEDKFLKKGINRAGLRESLEKELALCSKLLQEIYILEEDFKRMSKPLPSPPHAYRNTSSSWV
ncbi:MAG: hypothetical protein NT128_03700 [Proteobacteria bacterium]|nr:hypothetical protein [Pseudomonadota bacterium]